MSSSAGNDDGEADQNAVFLTTSLDTHLVTTVSGSEIVSDFKKRIMLEHGQCFPGIGNIIIHTLKVKRRGVFYYLSDSMPVKSAFGTTNRNWFVSADASRLEQGIDTTNFGNYELLLIQPKTIAFGNQISSNISGDSCKDDFKNTEENRSSDDKQLAIYKETTSKKRARDVSDKNLLKDSSQCELPLKKNRKSQKVKSNVKASEENIVLTHDNDKEKERGVSMNNENSLQHKSKNKDLIGENSKINNGEKQFDLDKVASVFSSGLECVGRETVADVAIVVEKNIQHGIFEKEKQKELVQKAVMENAIPSSMRASTDCVRDATGLNVAAPLNGGSKHSTKLPKAAENEVSSASFIKKLHDINKEAIDLLQQDVGFISQDFHGDMINKLTEDIDFSITQRPEVKLPEKRKKVKKSAAKNKIETPVMHANDNLVGDISSTVVPPFLNEKNIDGKNEVLARTFIDDDDKKKDYMIVKEMEVTEPTKSYRNLVHVETKEEKSENNLKDIVGSKKRKKGVKKTALKNDKSVIKQNEKHLSQVHDVDCVRNDNVLVNNDVDQLVTEKHLSQVHVEDANDKSEKQNETIDGVKKDKRKKKTKKSSSRNEDESIDKHLNGDNVKEHDSSLPHIDEGLAGGEKNKKINKSSSTGPQDRLLKDDQSTKTELESKKSQSIDHNDNLDDTSKNVIVSEVPKVNNKVDVTNDGSHEMNFLDHSAPNHQMNKTASVDTGKETKKPKKKNKKDDSKNDDDIQSPKITRNVGLVEKVKNSKSSLMGTQDQSSTYQSTEVQFVSEKSQSIDHHHHLDDASKNVTEVSKVNNKVDIKDDGSHEINFLNHFASDQQPYKNASIDNGKDSKKQQKKTKEDDSRNDGKIQSKKIISKIENNHVVTDPYIRNIDQIKMSRTTKNIDSGSSSSSKSFGRSFQNEKSNKQQQVMGSVKKVLPAVNSLLTTPGKIFADDDSDMSSADDNTTVNSDSLTRTPSRTSTSSGESASSLDSKKNRTHAQKRMEADDKNNTTEQKKPKIPFNSVLRRSSRFKIATSSSQPTEDTESQPVDFVPESQPVS